LKTTSAIGKTKLGREKLKVLLVGPVPPSLGGQAIGGVATHVAGLAKHLAQLGTLDVHLLAEGTSCESWDTWCQPRGGYTVYHSTVLQHMGAMRHRFDRVQRYGMSTIWKVGQVVPQAMRILQEYPASERNPRRIVSAALFYRYLFNLVQPDIVHVHDVVSHTLAWRLAVDRKAPVVVTLHGISPVLEDHPERHLEAVLRANLQASYASIAVSSYTREEAIRMGAPPERVVVIPVAIDCQEFAPLPQAESRQRLGLSEGPLVLYCGQLIPRKNVPMILDAFRVLLSEFPSARLAIVGDGPEEARVKSRAVESGIAARVLFAGARPHDELKWWYNASDVVVNASTSEGLAIVMLEAMACGRPVVASQSTYGSYDPLFHEQTGLVFQAGDAIDLAARIEWLLLHPEYACRLGQQARQLMVREYDWPVVAVRLAEFYHEVVLANGRGVACAEAF
jgi:teichuronic acid biosynthesis glycosyltransferase TuaC